MKIVDCGPQRSESWKEWRKGRVTASDVSAIMGENPSGWATAEDVFMEKLGLGKERVVTAAMQNGIDLESTVVAMLNQKLGVEFKPCVVESETYPWLGASLDGGYFDNEPLRWICEIKCPMLERGFIEAKQGIVPKPYQLQIQTQLLVTGADLCFYCVYYQDEIAVVEVRPDEEMQKRIIEETKAFWERVQNLEPPEPKYVERQDEEWLKEVATLSEIQRQLKTLQDQESESKARLIQLSDGKSTKGYGMGVIHSIRAGAIDYAKICAERNIDCAKYRKEPTQVVTVRKVK